MWPFDKSDKDNKPANSLDDPELMKLIDQLVQSRVNEKAMGIQLTVARSSKTATMLLLKEAGIDFQEQVIKPSLAGLQIRRAAITKKKKRIISLRKNADKLDQEVKAEEVAAADLHRALEFFSALQ